MNFFRVISTKRANKGGGDGCGKCGKVVKEGDRGVLCGVCKKWYHVLCGDLPVAVYDYLGGKGLHWYCEGCDGKMAELMRVISKVEEKVVKLEADLKVEIEGVKVDFMEKLRKVEEKLDKMTEDGIQVRGEGNGEAGLSRRDVIEQIERDKRKTNLMVMGIKEGEGELAVIKGMGNKIGVGIADGDILDVQRVGRREGNKNRPVKVVLKNMDQRAEILKKRVNLKGTEYRDYYFSPDLTPQQQVLDKKLRDKLKELRAVGNGIYKIKNGTIVKKEGTEEKIVFSPGQGN